MARVTHINPGVGTEYCEGGLVFAKLMCVAILIIEVPCRNVNIYFYDILILFILNIALFLETYFFHNR